MDFDNYQDQRYNTKIGKFYFAISMIKMVWVSIWANSRNNLSYWFSYYEKLLYLAYFFKTNIMFISYILNQHKHDCKY